MILVRMMEREHLDSVAEIEALCFSVPWSRAALELMIDRDVLALVALDGERVVGYVGMMCVLDEGQVLNLAVHPDARRQGIARMLMESAEYHAGARGLCILSLEVRESNAAARALYCSLGWSEAGVRKGFYSHPTEDAFVMIKSI